MEETQNFKCQMLPLGNLQFRWEVVFQKLEKETILPPWEEDESWRAHWRKCPLSKMSKRNFGD